MILSINATQSASLGSPAKVRATNGMRSLDGLFRLDFLPMRTTLVGFGLADRTGRGLRQSEFGSNPRALGGVDRPGVGDPTNDR